MSVAEASPGDLYVIQESSYETDDEWDAFVAGNAGGSMAQSSLWSRVKALSGWAPVRLIVRYQNEIVGGVQILDKQFIPGVHIGMVLHGPLAAENHPSVADLLLKRLQNLRIGCCIRLLLIQPPLADAPDSQPMKMPAEFHPSVFAFVVAATTVVDLESEPDALLAKMRSKTRYNVRLAQRKGIVIREASRADIGTFHRLLTLTGERQNFTPNGVSYFDAMWDILAPGDHIKLFLAELDGEVVSAILITAFGDTAVYKRGGWSGQHGSSHPNELLHWEAMLWAKSAGYHRYDFDGIDPVAVQAIESGEPVPTDISDAVVRFKLGFGGRVLMLPNYYVYIRNPLLRWCFINVFPRLIKVPKVEKLFLGLDRT